jgi:hypothetical protein
MWRGHFELAPWGLLSLLRAVQDHKCCLLVFSFGSLYFLFKIGKKRGFCLSLVNFSEHKGFSRLWQLGVDFGPLLRHVVTSSPALKGAWILHHLLGSLQGLHEPACEMLFTFDWD